MFELPCAGNVSKLVLQNLCTLNKGESLALCLRHREFLDGMQEHNRISEAYRSSTTQTICDAGENNHTGQKSQALVSTSKDAEKNDQKSATGPNNMEQQVFDCLCT